MSDTRTKLIQDLQRIEDEKYQLREGEQLQDFVALMLEYIGDPKEELRDYLIYPTFYYWIQDENKFTAEELRNLLAVLTDQQHLFYQIGTQNDQTVFTRSFSSLPIALLLKRHRNQPFMTQEDLDNLKKLMLRYYKEEKDLRGLLPEGGWAHSASHGADVFVELVQCVENDATFQREVLDAIQGMLHNEFHIFSEEDDERITSIVDTMIVKGMLPEQEMADWINALAECGGWPRSRTQVIARVNTKNFLRSLYFRRAQDQCGKDLTANLLAAEGKVNRFAIK